MFLPRLIALFILTGLFCAFATSARAEAKDPPLEMPTTDTVRVDPARASTTAHDATNTGVLVIEMKDFKNDDGVARLAVFPSDEGWPGEWSDAATVYAATEISSRAARLTARGLPFGSYAVTVYHDKNDSGRLDSFMGVPTEAYGFSNDARGMMSAPSFEKAKIELKETSRTIVIHMEK